MFAFKYNSNGRLIQALSYKHYKYTVLLYPRNMTLDLGTRHFASLSLVDQPGYGTCSILEVLIFNFICSVEKAEEVGTLVWCSCPCFIVGQWPNDFTPVTDLLNVCMIF